MPFLLVKVDSEDKAGRLSDKLAELAGVEILAWFKTPTRYCECDLSTLPDAHFTPRGRRNGWRICPACKRPREGKGQVLVPIDQVGLPPMARNIHLSMPLPWKHPLKSGWTPDKIYTYEDRVADAGERIDRRALKKRRKRRRAEA